MLGLNDIEMLVHQLEDCVEGIKAGKGDITPQLCDRLYQGIDAVNQLSHQAITGEKVEVNTFEVLALLMGAESASPSDLNTAANDDDLFGDESSSESSLFDDDDLDTHKNNEDSLFDDSEDDLFNNEIDVILDTGSLSIGRELETTQSQTVQTTASVTDYQIDTIRVEPKKLDTLMTQASELTVTKLRISQQVTEINQMEILWEEWNKEQSRNSSFLDQVANSLPPEKFHLLQYFFDNAQQRLESLGNLVSNFKTRANEDITSLGIGETHLKGIDKMLIMCD